MKLKTLLFTGLSFLALNAAAQQPLADQPNDENKSWSVGVNAGLMSPYSIIFLAGKSHNLELNAGYGAFVKKQLNKRFGVELSYHGGSVSDKLKTYNSKTTRRSFDSEIAYTTSINGLVNIVDFNVLKKKQPISLYSKAGVGIAAYAPSYITGAGEEIDLKNKAGKDGESTYYHATVFPVGLGFKTNISRAISAHANYSIYFLTRDNLDGPTYKGTDRWSYASLGIEYSFR